MDAWPQVGAAVTEGPTSAGNCAGRMAGLMTRGANASHALQLRAPPGRGGAKVAKITVAAFLIARGAGAVIVIPPFDRPLLGTRIVLEGVNVDADPGTPVQGLRHHFGTNG